MYEDLTKQAEQAVRELLEAAKLKKGDLFVVGCSTSEVDGAKIRADAGLDIGGTLIGMQLRPVAVPVRLSLDMIGKARILCARTRPKFIGGVRAHYDESQL